MASARLKRKLEVDPDASSRYGNLNESFVEIGTALPSLASNKKDTNEFKPIWEQEVFDEQGRKRLHGAFTGGFSAGYFNTVGSKEGWVPSAFESSRKNRASKTGGKGNDMMEAAKQFMDDEDLSELASSRKLETSSSYAAPPPTSSTYDPLMGVFNPPPQPSTSSSNMGAQAALASLIEPSSSRIGAKLMKKMGWREGQGVGPRLTYEQRKRQAHELGIALDEDSETGDEVKTYFFAPLDRPLMLLNGVSSANDRGWGLGYGRDGKRQKGRETMKNLRLGQNRVDDDPYADEDDVQMKDSSRPMIEFGDDEDQETVDDYRIQRSGAGTTKSLLVKDPNSKAAEEFHDRTRLLPGFVLYHEPFAPASISQLPPHPPKEWRPDPRRIWAEEAAEARGEKGTVQLSAEQRGNMLGEQLPPPPPKSVFDYLSARDKERISTMKATGSFPPPKLGPAPSSTLSSGTSSNTTPLGATNRFSGPSSMVVSASLEPDEELTIPHLDSSTAFAALKGFQPFSAASTSPDPTRQARYTLFLQYSARQLPESTGLPFGPRLLPSTGKTQTMKEFNRELVDYVNAAKVFKPVSGMLGNRFTSGGGETLVPKIEPGLYQPPPKPIGFVSSSVDTGDEPPKKAQVELTPVQKAILSDDFGHLTRTTAVFRPAQLLCKRFGVPDPFAVGKGAKAGEGEEGEFDVGGKWKEASIDGNFVASLSSGSKQGQVKDVLGKESMEELLRSANGATAAHSHAFSTGTAIDHLAEAASTKLANKQAIPTLETVGLGDDERQGEETLTYIKAPKDIFDAIFKDSDDEDDDDDEQDFTSNPEGLERDSGHYDVSLTNDDSKDPPLEGDLVEPKSEAASGPTLAETTQILSTETVVDYKPTFAKPAKSRTMSDVNGASERKKKTKKSTKRKSATLSFDLDGEEEHASESRESEEKKAKRGKKEVRTPREKTTLIEEEEEWEEAPSVVHPSIVAASISEKHINY